MRIEFLGDKDLISGLNGVQSGRPFKHSRHSTLDDFEHPQIGRRDATGRLLGHVVLQILDGATFFGIRDQIFEGRLVRIAPHKSHRQNQLPLRQRDGEVRERIERDGHFIADWTGEFGLVLTGKEIVDVRVVALAMHAPRLVGNHVIGATVGFHGGGVRLVDDPVEILVKTVEEESQEFLGVVLSEARELRRLCEYVWERMKGEHDKEEEMGET